MHCTGNAPLHSVRARSFAPRPVQRIVAPDHGGIVHELLTAASVQTVRSLQTVREGLKVKTEERDRKELRVKAETIAAPTAESHQGSVATW